MLLPDFIGIGAQRAGTTLLYEFLRQYPRICMARYRKEVHYFDRYFYRGEKWYRSLFDHCKGKCAGEITPDYIYKEGCAARIWRLSPEVKLIAVLRNPIDRAYSQFKKTIKDKGYGRSFSEFLEDYKDAAERGLYYKQIRQYLSFFPPEKLKILLFEDMMTNPSKEMSEIFKFLEVDASFVSITPEKRVNPSQIPRLHGLYVFGKRISTKLHDRDLTWVIAGLKKVGVNRLFFSKREDRGDFPELTEHHRNWLEQFYKKDVVELSSFLDRDLIELWGFHY